MYRLTMTCPDRTRPRLIAFGAGLAFAALASLAVAQDASRDPPTAAAPVQTEASPPAGPAPGAASAPALPTPPEVFSAIGRFIDQSISNVGTGVGAGVKGAGDTLGATTNAAGEIAKGVTDAAGTVARLPRTNIVAGWEACTVAANGAPDCGVASIALCRSKGFERGNSVDITSSRKCPAQMWREGRAPSDAECKNESFVSRAICQ